MGAGWWLVAVLSPYGGSGTADAVTFDSTLAAEVRLRDPGRDVVLLDPGSAVRT